jgi:hypothetical protein
MVKRLVYALWLVSLMYNQHSLENGKKIDNLNQQLESNEETVQFLQKMYKQTRSKHHTCYLGTRHKQCFGNSVIKQLKLFHNSKGKLNESVGTLPLQNEA